MDDIGVDHDPLKAFAFIAIADPMVYIGKLIGESLQLSRQFAAADLWRRDVALEPCQDLAIEATTVPFGTFLKLGVQMHGDVLQCQSELGFSRGTIIKPA